MEPSEHNQQQESGGSRPPDQQIPASSADLDLDVSFPVYTPGNFTVATMEQFLHHRRLSPADQAALFVAAFHGRGCHEKLRLLDRHGVLEDLLPEFRKYRDLTMDERWNGDTTLGEHCFLAPQVVDALLQKDEPVTGSDPVELVLASMLLLDSSSNLAGVADLLAAQDYEAVTVLRPRFEMMLRLAGFFHDLGKNDDMDHVGQGKRLLVPSREGDPFRRVRFSGHEQKGADVFSRRMGKIQELLPAHHRFSAAEFEMMRLWVRNHGLGREMARDNFDESRLFKYADRICKAAYPVELFNERMSICKAVCGSLILQEMEIGLAHPHLISQSNRNPSIPENEWRELGVRVQEDHGHFLQIVNATLHNISSFLTSEYLEKTAVQLVGGIDFEKLGIPPRKRGEAERAVYDARENLTVHTRLDALRVLEKYGETELNEGELEKFAVQTAGYNLLTTRAQGRTLLEVTQYDGYVIRRYEAKPIRQISAQSDPKEALYHVETGAYPAIKRWLDGIERGSRADELHDLFVRDLFCNLDGFEAFLTLHSTDPRELTEASSPLINLVEIESQVREEEPRIIQVPQGFQGAAHVGFGALHYNKERKDVLMSHFPEGDWDRARNIFENEGVFPVSGRSLFQYPSHVDFADRRLFLGRMKGPKDFYVMPVIERTDLGPHKRRVSGGAVAGGGDANPFEVYRLVTAFFFPNGGKVRDYLGWTLRKQKKTERPIDELDGIQDTMNRFLDENEIGSALKVIKRSAA